MRNISTSTIAQLLFVKPPRLNFAHMVGELDCALARCPTQSHRLTWDCEDIALFDLDDARIVLGYAERPGHGHGACLTASVGPRPGSDGTSPLLKRGEAMCRLIVDRIQSRFQADAILWHQSDEPLTSELLDAMTEELPPLDVIKRSRVRPIKIKVNHPATDLANDRADRPQAPSAELMRLRSALYPEGYQGESTPVMLPAPRATPAQRLAVHALNATLVLVSLPVGAAMITYSVLRGEDMRLSGRAMALTGAALAFSQSAMGQSMLAAI
ncbi:hypothetical protein GEU84_000930 [Fertoebacter nigrum]|uniref:Uncharacterized protein n=1 Tax=Fertoeibacter niger TaxID=2656921 RepID=A0A8X8KMP3_9RHOB|nr:hypothetical protein [Fertoeibacter niger]NUB42936.1 hypothetical protein [Fertoeibacter niger]